MNRPSHYLLLVVLLFVGYLLTSGRLPVETTALRKPTEVVAAREPRAKAARPASVVAGIVLDALGFRVVGAEVAIRGRDERARTDGDGQFRFELEGAGSLWLSASATGFRSVQREVHPAAGDPVVFALEPQAPWDAAPPLPPAVAPSDFVGEGFVRDGDGKAVAGAMVVVAETSACARTDDIGRYRIDLPQEGPATLLVHDPEGANGKGRSARSEPQQFSRRRGLLPLSDLMATTGAAIRGTLRDSSGQPLAGVPLLLRGQGLQRSFLSGADGVFRVAGLLAGSYQLLACAWRGAVAAVQEVNVDAAVVDCDVRLVATSSRHLRVVDENGQPVARAFVATTFLGSRRGVGQADQSGALDLPGAQPPADFEVRSAGEHRELAVRRVEPDGVLVVAAP